MRQCESCRREAGLDYLMDQFDSWVKGNICDSEFWGGMLRGKESVRARGEPAHVAMEPLNPKPELPGQLCEKYRGSGRVGDDNCRDSISTVDGPNGCQTPSSQDYEPLQKARIAPNLILEPLECAQIIGFHCPDCQKKDNRVIERAEQLVSWPACCGKAMLPKVGMTASIKNPADD